MTLSNVLQQINQIGSTTKMKEKENMIKEFSKDLLFQKVVYYAINPFKQFNTKTISFINDSDNNNINDIFNFLDYLTTKRGANSSDILELSRLSSIDIDTFEIINRIINKDLKCGANIKTFKKFIPNIPDHNVMMCENSLDRFLKLCNNDFSRIMWSIKFDGVRCTTIGNGIYLSRNGKEFPNFQVFDNEISLLKDKLEEKTKEMDPEIDLRDVAIDGEVISTSPTFQDLMTQVRRIKDIDTSKFRFYIFDITLENYSFAHRYTLLVKAFEELKGKINKLELVDHNLCSNFSTIEEIKELANHKIDIEGYEGLVLKDLYSIYERKRSRYWCKIKKTHTSDVRVLNWSYGSGKNSNCIGDFICQFSNGVTFNVGSGLTDNQRIEFMKEIPNIIEIEYQELNKDGKPRFPVFKRVRDDKNEID